MAFTSTPLDGSATPIPMSTVVPDGTNTPLALEGGPSIVTGGNTIAPVSIYVKDGNDVTKGATTDPAWAGSGAGTEVAILKKIVTQLIATLAVMDIEQANYIAATTPPTATSAGVDTSYTFSSQVNRVIIQNNTSANVNYAFDATASAGSLMLTPGSTIVYPKKCTTLHLFTAAAQNINGTSAANVVVLGAL